MALLSRHHRRAIDESAVRRAAWNPSSLLIPPQLRIHEDKAQLRLADGTRRCGKSFFAAVELLVTALAIAKSKSLFLALTREDARDLVWQWLLDLNEQYCLGGKPDLNRLAIRMPNGSIVKLGGAKDPAQAARWRGRGFALVIIDECQTFPSHLRDLVESGLLPTLLKSGGHGRMILMGTPGEVPGVGYWEEKVRDEEWSKHRWTLHDNPTLGTPEEVEAFLDKMARAYGGRHTSRFRREFLGERPPPDALDRPYQYDPTTCDPETLGFRMPRASDSYVRQEANRWEVFNRWELPLGGHWRFVEGVDIGSRAASAIATLGVTDEAPGKVWLVEEWLGTRPGIDKLGTKLQERRVTYNPVVTAVDEGALGDMIADQWRGPPWHLPVTAAEKLHEHVHCDFVSAAMARGEFLIPKDSRLAEDMAVLRWDEKKLVNGKRKVALTPHSDIEPASRYAFKDAFALAMATRRPAPPVRTDEQREDVALAKERREGARRKAADGRAMMGGKASSWRVR